MGGDTLDELSAAAGAEIDLSDTEAPTGSELEQAQEASVIKLVNDHPHRGRQRARHRCACRTLRARTQRALPHRRRVAARQRSHHDQSLRNAAIISRIKIMANLNIAEKRKPQDGRITLRHKGHEYDLRVSLIPMLWGEGVVLRILDKSAVMFQLEQLGMQGEVLGAWGGTDPQAARHHSRHRPDRFG